MAALVPRKESSRVDGLGLGLAPAELVALGLELGVVPSLMTEPLPVFAALIKTGSSFCNFSNRMLAFS